MKFRLKRAGFLALFALTVFACDKDDDPAVQNSLVTPQDFLASTTYKSLTVEIVYVEGFQPASATVNNITAFLAARLNKPSGINITQRSIASPGGAPYSADRLRSIEKSNRQQNTGGQTLTAYFFFADGDYSGSSGASKTLGVAYGQSSMAMFEKTVREFAGGLNQPSVATLETTVLEHEFGHVLGLVSNGTPLQSQHQDAAHPGHCNNQDCLMYYLAETSGIATNLFGGSIPVLDASCLADLKANGGK